MAKSFEEIAAAVRKRGFVLTKEKKRGHGYRLAYIPDIALTQLRVRDYGARGVSLMNVPYGDSFHVSQQFYRLARIEQEIEQLMARISNKRRREEERLIAEANK